MTKKKTPFVKKTTKMTIREETETAKTIIKAVTLSKTKE
tara:strand:- start:428 stop:544 length:117 start_codon:yes stop_codon:yes gene_type:complete